MLVIHDTVVYLLSRGGAGGGGVVIEYRSCTSYINFVSFGIVPDVIYSDSVDFPNFVRYMLLALIAIYRADVESQERF